MTAISSQKTSTRREKQTRYLSQAIQLEEAVNPHIIRATMGMVSLAVLAFVLWASFTNIHEIARTPGEVVPKGYQQTVQHLEGGIVKSINVQEGQIVEAGQTLVILDETSLNADLTRAQSRQITLEMQEERLRAFVENRTPDFKKFGAAANAFSADQNAFFDSMKSAREKEAQIIREQIEQKRQSISSFRADLATAQTSYRISNNMYDKRAQLNQRGYASDMSLLESEARMNHDRGEISRLKNQISVAGTEVEEFENRLKSLNATQLDEAYEKLDMVAAEKIQNIEILEKIQERISRMELKSPTKGLVKGLSINTVGAVVKPAQTIMEIVPMDKALEVEVKISPKDIGHVKVGQNVQVKFSSFDFSRYGVVKGKLQHISATTFTGEGGERYYQGRIMLDQSYVGGNSLNSIMPGMTVMADVITGEKTIIEYLLKPIHRSLLTAFTER